MKTFKLSKVLSNNFDDGPENACIYVIRDDETVFYVGKTKRAISEGLIIACFYG